MSLIDDPFMWPVSFNFCYFLHSIFPFDSISLFCNFNCMFLNNVPHCFPSPCSCRTFSLKLCVILQVLKETLVRHGFTFESETDTEVIPKLAKFVFDKANEEGIFLVK